MDKFIFFLHIIAWVFGIISTLAASFVTYMGLVYPGSIEQTVDNIKGYNRTFNPFRLWIIALVCWAFIIAF